MPRTTSVNLTGAITTAHPYSTIQPNGRAGGGALVWFFMQSNHWPAVAVVGAGAVGCYFGGMLARAGVPVVLIGRARHMEAIARDGLLLEGTRIHERIPLQTSTSIECIGDTQVVLFCVKTVDTETAALQLRPFLTPDAAVLSFQNGVDNVDRMLRTTGVRAVPVAVYVAAAMTGPGHVTHTGRGDLVLGHRAGWPSRPDLQPLSALFEHAGIPCRISEAIEADLWTKMVMNCAYNAISALTRARYGRILEFPPLREVMRRAIAETVGVARAEGVSLSEPALVEAAFQLGEAMRGAHSSTAQDIGLGRPTEIDSLNGFVARRGAQLGIATPVNDTLYALVKLLEQSGH
ncbi:MAG: ketopantoate reductase family protein [Rudaea sp.]